MGNELEPVVGQWYWHRDKGQSFAVVAVGDDTVEIQHYDGDLEELDSSDWPNLEIDLAEPPDDWTGPIDDLETDDLGYSDTGMDPESWGERGKAYRKRPESWAPEPRGGGGEESAGPPVGGEEE